MEKILRRKNNSTSVVGIGSALVDILLQESDDFLKKSGAQKGGMTLVENYETIESIVRQSKHKPTEVPGGSACNTIIGIGKLGNSARFIGKRGNDELGKKFETALRTQNVEPLLELSDTPTGRVLSIITPDAQRSMLTFLGASSESKPQELSPDKFKNAALVHLEGYLLFNQQLMAAALEAAKKADALISLDLASYTVVEASKSILKDIVREYVDILLANEDEARAYTGSTDEQEALKILAKDTTIAVMKVGKRGSFIQYQDKKFTIGIQGTGVAIDTTGAGDLWASGFLYGLVNDYPMQKCGEIGAACGYEVCQVIGAHIPQNGWSRIKKQLSK